MKIIIIIDTNQIRYGLGIDARNKESGGMLRLFNNNVDVITKFVSDNKQKDIQIVIPDLVISEILHQRKRDIDEALESIEANLHGLRAKIDLSKIKNRNYKNLLKKKAIEFVKKNKIDVIKNITINQTTFLDRSLSRVAPFGNKRAGFRDTVIWLSVLNHAKENPKSNYLFFTKNYEDFIPDKCINEFSSVSKSELVFVSSVDEIKQYIDKKLKLDLKLKKLHRKIANEIKEKSGTLLTILKKHFSNERGGFSYDQIGHYGMVGFGGIGENENIDEYDLIGLRINNISEKDKQQAYIVDLEADIEESKQIEPPSIHINVAQVGAFKTRKQIKFQIEYDSNKREIDLTSAAINNNPQAYAVWNPDWPPAQ